MIEISKIKPGDKVHYKPDFYGKDEAENGIVKEVSGNIGAFVVYKCDGNWDNYYDYTGQLTWAESLHYGWK